MPAFGKMSDEKVSTTPVVIAEVPQSCEKRRKTKKYVIIAVSAILAGAIILTAILVGMYMFTEAQKEIIKYTLQLGTNTKQDVTSDPNENVVQYHISNANQDTWIVNDFGKDIQLMKITSDGKTNCFISPLNRTNLLDPSQITGPESNDVNDAHTLTYRTSDTPVTDTSFLSKTAKDMCKGISIYWLYPHCINDAINDNITGMDHPKTKRQATVDYSPYYIKNYVSYLYNRVYYSVPCFTGCCRRICACTIYYSAYISGGRMYCNWITYTCPPVLYGTLQDTCVIGPRGISCPNYRPTYTPYC